ncbi:MAG TPA: thioredoxin domain-containing protein [Chthoniobacterales bacterium]|nr:thioredoxin domain-containing protein [Chthoniobacterales bacterium]
MKLLRIAALLIVLPVITNASAPPGEQVRPANAMGPADAPVVIEFFSDLQCPQCARYEPMVVSVRKEFGDKTRMVIRHFPLSGHEHAILAACAAEAAANQHKFWEMVEALYKTQWMWARAPAPRTILLDQAKSLGLDVDQFQKDLDAEGVRERIGADEEHARSVGVKTAPSVVINGYNLPNTQFNENGIRAAIQAALDKAALDKAAQ